MLKNDTFYKYNYLDEITLQIHNQPVSEHYQALLGESRMENAVEAADNGKSKIANAILTPDEQKELDARVEKMLADGTPEGEIPEGILLYKDFLLKKRKINRENAKSQGRQLSLFPASQIPECKHSRTGPLNNDFARSNLFQAIQPGTKRLRYDNQKLNGPSNCDITFTGPQLSLTDDALVYINALRLSANAKANDRIIIDRGDFLRTIGWKTKHMGKNDYAWLDASFNRLAESRIVVRIKDHYIKTHLIGGLTYDSDIKEYGFSIPPETLFLFRENYFSYINIDLLAKHKNSAITVWMILYASSHRDGEHRRRLELLREWSGHKTAPAHFYKMVNKAISVLIKDEFFLDGNIELAKPISQSMVCWNKDP